MNVLYFTLHVIVITITLAISMIKGNEKGNVLYIMK